MATSPHSNPEVAGSSLARSQCPYGSGFTPRLRLAGWRSARWDHLGGWEDRGISPPPHSFLNNWRLGLKSDRSTKATRSKIEARNAKRKSGGLFVPEAQGVYIIFYIYHTYPTGF
ncbi:hypothetical protein Hanom_Chr01g00011721 [Helianthus anomalus]